MDIVITELRWRMTYTLWSLLLCMPCAWYCQGAYIDIYGTSVVGGTLYALDVGETLYTSLYVCVHVASIALCPYALYTWWCYISPGLYRYERVLWYRRMWGTYIYGLSLYTLGLLYIWPQVVHMFHGEIHDAVTHMPRAYSYVCWGVWVPLYTVLCGLCPLLLYCSGLSTHTYVTYRPLWCLSSVLLGALLAPPVYGQMVLTLVLVGIYECVVLIRCVNTS